MFDSEFDFKLGLTGALLRWVFIPDAAETLMETGFRMAHFGTPDCRCRSQDFRGGQGVPRGVPSLQGDSLLP